MAFSTRPIFLIPLAALALFALQGCDGRDAQAQDNGGMPPPPAVIAVNPVLQTIEEWEKFSGRFEAMEKVEIRSRVSGYLQEVHFKDGQMVNKGDVLFTIDPRPFQASVREAEAQLRSAQNRQTLAKKELQRNEELAQQGYASKQSLDIKTQEQQTATSEVEAARARMEQTKLDLEFTKVKSPITGRVSRRMVDVGNLVTGGTNGTTHLTTVMALDPIHFYFDVDEQTYLKYARTIDSTVKSGSAELDNPVEIALSDSKIYSVIGKLDFFDTNLDSQTGTLRMRAVFDNPDYMLIPGMFGRARLRGGEKYEAIVVPDEALGLDQSRIFVMTVGEGNIVASKNVTLGPVVDGRRVITHGLTTDDVVIVKGIQMLRDGMPVSPEIKTMDALVPPEPAAIAQPAE